MTKYLISFPPEAMKLSQEDFVQAGIDAHGVVAEAKAAGVWVFGGGIAEDVDPVMVAADGGWDGDARDVSRQLPEGRLHRA